MSILLALFGNWRLALTGLAIAAAVAAYGVLWVRYTSSQTTLARTTAEMAAVQAALDVSRSNNVTLRATIADMNNRAEQMASEARARSQQSAGAVQALRKLVPSSSAADAAVHDVPATADSCSDAQKIIQDFVKRTGQ